MNNHIFLILSYIDQLVYLTRTQQWLDGARSVAKHPKMRAVLDDHQARVIAQKIKLQDEMFEIQRNN